MPASLRIFDPYAGLWSLRDTDNKLSVPPATTSAAVVPLP